MAKLVTAEYIMNLLNVPESACNEKITNVHLQEIALKRCRKWRDLLVLLDMEKTEADDLDRKQISETEKIKEFLEKWKQVNGSEATYKALMNALLKIQYRDDAEFVCKLAFESKQPQDKKDETDSPSMTSEPPLFKSASSPTRLSAPTVPQKKTVSIIFAGKGKTKLFANLFDEDMEALPSKLQVSGKTMHITSISSIADERKLTSLGWGIENADLLVYCLRADPGTRFRETNPELIQMLKVKCKGIWRNAIVVLTFSNITWLYTQEYNKSNPEEQYRSYLHDCSARLSDEFQGDKVHPKVIFEYMATRKGKASDDQTIPVIPAGFEPNDIVLPKTILQGKSWMDVIFHEMCNKCKNESREVLQSYRNAIP